MTVPLWILAVIATLLFLRTAASLLIPIVIAIILSYAFEPLVAWLERHRVHRLAGTLMLMLALTGVVAWGAWSLTDNVEEAARALPRAAERLRTLIESQTTSGPGADLREAAETLRGDDPADETTPPSPRPQPQFPAPVAGLALFQQGVVSIFALAGHALVVFFLLFFLLASGPHFRHRLIEVAGPQLQQRLTAAQIITDIDSQIQRFLLVRLVTAVAVAVATWMALAWLGVANAVVWATLAGVFNSIPYFGPVIVSGGLFAVGLAQDGSLTSALQMSGAALVITSLEGWLLTPPLMGRAERMNVLAVFLGLLVWTWVWGAWGTLLAVPMLVIVKSVADHVESLRPVGRLLAP